MFTEPLIEILEVKSPSTLSRAVAPCSVYGSPTLRFIVESPIKVIIGGTVSATTFTVLFIEALLPAESVTL